MEPSFSHIMFQRRNLNDGNDQGRQGPCPIARVHVHAHQRFFCYFSESVSCLGLTSELVTCTNAPSSHFPGPFSSFSYCGRLFRGAELKHVFRTSAARLLQCWFWQAVSFVLRAVPCVQWAVMCKHRLKRLSSEQEDGGYVTVASDDHTARGFPTPLRI